MTEEPNNVKDEAIEMKRFITPGSSVQQLDNDSVLLNMEDYEFTPLDSDLPVELVHDKKCRHTKKRVGRNMGESWRGPLKAIKILLLAAVVPSLFIFIPLYLRYNVFSGQLYPVGMSDMRLIDKRVSTTWCQRQVVRSNATFNAFLMSGLPQISQDIIPVSMTRQLTLEDDMKEYWGFYLLEGSTVTVSTCVRWPGASLIMIRGHRHLKECAYIGDDSSEELEEVLRANGGILPNATLQSLKKLIDQPSNRPKNMTRHLSGVLFHEPRPPALKTSSAEEFHTQPHDEEKDLLDPKILHLLLSQLKESQDKQKKKRDPKVRPSYIVPVQKLTHRYRETNVNEDEEKWLSFKDLEDSGENNEENDNLNANFDDRDIVYDINRVADKENNINKIKDTVIDENIIKDKETDHNPTESNSDNNLPSSDNSTNDQVLLSVSGDENTNKLNPTEKTTITKENIGVEDTNQSSSEIFEDVYSKLEKLGDKGKSVIKRLNDRITTINNTAPFNSTEIHESPVDTEIYDDYDNTNDDLSEDLEDKKLEVLKNLLMDVINEEIKAKKDRQARKRKENLKRLKRELFIEQKLDKMLTEDDEKGNMAIEEEFEPDGIADHHVRLNESTLNDMSKSEFWSSFSSSEEALLECDGLILNLPLTPNRQCEATDLSVQKHDHVSKANTVTYKVPTNGYYFFVFNSENEVQENYIRVRFDLKKTVYDLKQGKVMECKNSTDKCFMPLDFFSGEKVVFEVPVRDNDSLWNEDFVVISECEPRTLIYVFCVIAVPIFIVMMALH